MAEETAAATRVVHRTCAADFAITIQRFLVSLLNLSGLIFCCLANALFPLQLHAPLRVISCRHTHQVNPVWKLKQLPDVAVPESDAMV
jgi:hypothetical protein